MTCNGISQGSECWLVRSNEPHAPIRCHSAVLLMHYGECHVWHEGQTYDRREVFATEAEARREALRSATWYRDHFASQSARMALVVRELEGAQ